MEANLRLRIQSVFSEVLEQGKTFEQVAQKYNLEISQFEQMVKSMTSPKDFKRLNVASKRNQNFSGRKDKEETVKHEEKTIESKPITYETLQVQYENAKSNIDYLERYLQNEQGLLEVSQKEVEALNAQLKRAEESVRKHRIQIQEKRNTLTEWRICLEGIIGEISELKSKEIYLVEPGYSGELPEFGRLISVEPMEGVNVEKVDNVPLFHDFTPADFFMFDDMKRARSIYQFLQLVTLYFVEGKSYKLLVEDEVVISLLRKQELIQ